MCVPLSKEIILVSEVEWKYYKSSKYYLPTLKTSKTREDAKAFCASLGGHLVALETPEENEFVYNLVFQTGRSTVGCTRRAGPLNICAFAISIWMGNFLATPFTGRSILVFLDSFQLAGCQDTAILHEYIQCNSLIFSQIWKLHQNIMFYQVYVPLVFQLGEGVLVRCSRYIVTS